MGLLQRLGAAWRNTFTVSATNKRSFAAARMNRYTAGWMADYASINRELQSDLDALRARGRNLIHNNDFAARFRAMVQDNIIGPHGVRLQVRIEDKPGQRDELANDAVEAAWLDWCKQADLSGQLTFTEMCRTLIGGMPSDGEFLVLMVKGKDAHNKYNFALQMIDVDRIDSTYNGQYQNNLVIMGVEVDTYRRPVALHCFEAHPFDGSRSSRQRKRWAIDNVIHAFKLHRAEQMRGIPWMTSGMLSLHHLGNFGLSALLAAEHGANHYGFFTTPDGLSPAIATDKNDGQEIVTTQPGTFDTLPEGVQFQAYDSKYPNEVFGPFIKTTLQRIASGWGVAYNTLANDLEGVNFSSIRSGKLEERERWAGDQEWFIGAFLEKVYPAWLNMALLSGAVTMPNGSALPAAKYQKFLAHEWQPRRWEWVDPKADMESKILAVRAGLMPPQDLAAAMGYDFYDTLKQIAAAEKTANDLGVTLTAYMPTPGATPNGNANAQPDAKAKP